MTVKILTLLALVSLGQLAKANSPCEGNTGKPHPNGGGFVADTAYASVHVHVGPDAQICESAMVFGYSQVFGQAKIYGHAVVMGGFIYGNAEVYGNAQISDEVNIHENAKIFGRADIRDKVEVKGVVKISRGIHDGEKLIDGKYCLLRDKYCL